MSIKFSGLSLAEILSNATGLPVSWRGEYAPYGPVNSVENPADWAERVRDRKTSPQAEIGVFDPNGSRG